MRVLCIDFLGGGFVSSPTGDGGKGGADIGASLRTHRLHLAARHAAQIYCRLAHHPRGVDIQFVSHLPSHLLPPKPTNTACYLVGCEFVPSIEPPENMRDEDDYIQDTV